MMLNHVSRLFLNSMIYPCAVPVLSLYFTSTILPVTTLLPALSRVRYTPRRDSVPGIVPAIPHDGVAPGGHRLIGQCPHPLPGKVVHDERGVAALRQCETDRRRRIEGIGVGCYRR